MAPRPRSTVSWSRCSLAPLVPFIEHRLAEGKHLAHNVPNKLGALEASRLRKQSSAIELMFCNITSWNQ
eukprot:12056-Pyramimonas_sp.AAC.1